MLARLKKSDEMREFFIEMWKQNPALAKQGGGRVQNLLSAVESKHRGISLIELIIFIVIISVALTGILLVMNQVTRHSADPLIHKQAIAAAESLLEEIELQDFISASGVTNAVTQVNRASEYHIVNDYNNFPPDNATGIFPVSGVAAIPGLENYKAKVAITNEALNGVLAGSAVRITVTVTDPQNNAIAIDGYRTAY
jgi:MSHA pilin protein MshD